SGAAADVEDAGAGQQAFVGQPLDALEAQPCGRMQARAERHARIEGEDDIAGLTAVAAPGRSNDETAPDSEHREVRLPCLGPVHLVNDACLDIADGPETERLEMTQGLPGSRHRPTSSGAITCGQIGTDDGRPTRVDPSR